MKESLILVFLGFAILSKGQTDTLRIHKVPTDFIPDGKGSHTYWQATPWVDLPKIDTISTPYTSRIKALYTSRGMYILFDGTDNKITSRYKKDFSDMYKADVFEIFLHPDPLMPLYFEYEINPFNKELVLLIPNLKGGAAGWTPWHYEGAKKTIKQVSIRKEKGKMVGWMAEVFIPFFLLAPLGNNPPSKGSSWKGTFCRLDYDSGQMIKWSWAPILVSFHEYKNYKTILFD